MNPRQDADRLVEAAVAGIGRSDRSGKEGDMGITPTVRRILNGYEADSPGTKSSLAQLLSAGRLGGTGRLVILPVDQGFEHGPGRSFLVNPAAFDPHYHFRLAIDAGLSAFAAPLGMLEAGADTFAGEIPLILKANSSNSWATEKDQAATAGVADAVRLGCCAIGLTIYPGSQHALELIEEAREIRAEAAAAGLATVVWSYPRGGDLSKEGETALDVAAYSAHIAALIGAHVVKVKIPTAHVEQAEAREPYSGRDWSALPDRIAHVVQSCLAGRRLVVFSGGGVKDEDDLLAEVRGVREGGGNGSIIGRNVFQRPREEALRLLDRIVETYLEDHPGA